jgi:hypothetical protein
MVRFVMAKSKLSVSLDPIKLKQAQSLVDAHSVSELLDVALARLIEEELERRHVDGYERVPVQHDLAAWAELPREADRDEVDWAALYGIKN